MNAVFDMSTLTTGEVADFEEVTGIDLWQSPDGWKPNARERVALGWLAARRRDPAFTLEDARNLDADEWVNLMVPTKAAPAAGSEEISSTGSPSSRASTGSARRTSGR